MKKCGSLTVTIIFILILIPLLAMAVYFKNVGAFKNAAFSCPPLRGFTFTYLVSKDRTPDIKKPSGAGGECVVSLDESRQMKVASIFYAGVPGEMEAPASLSLKTARGIAYSMDEHQLRFWAGDSVVHIEFTGFKETDSRFKKALFKKIIDTFRIDPS